MQEAELRVGADLGGKHRSRVPCLDELTRLISFGRCMLENDEKSLLLPHIHMELYILRLFI